MGETKRAPTDLSGVLLTLEQLDHLKHLQSPDIYHFLTPEEQESPGSN